MLCNSLNRHYTVPSGTVDYMEDGVTGLFFDPGSSDRMSEAIRRLWNDRGLRERLALNARKKAQEEFSNSKVDHAIRMAVESVFCPGTD